MSEKLFILKKYVRAKNAADAIRKDKKAAVDEVSVDERADGNAPPRIQH